jgi:hypothetical protein
MQRGALAWHRAAQSAVCDVLEPWEHGTVVRATRHPSYFDFNVVRVEEDPGMSVDALVSFADEALAGLAHRRIDFEVVAAAEPRSAGFEALGWMAMRLVWMRHAAAAPPGAEAPVEEVPYDAVRELRRAWHLEDFPDQDPTAPRSSAGRSPNSLRCMTPRSRNASIGAAAALVVAGTLCAVLFDGTAAGVVSIMLIGVGLVLAVSLVFFAIGLSEDRERAEEERRR